MADTIVSQVLTALEGQDHVIWDWNGTLLDDVEHAVATLNHTLELHEVPPVSREHYRKTFGFPVRAFYDQLGLDFKRESFESLCERFVARFMDEVRGVPLLPHSVEVVRILHARGVRQSVLSASDQASLDLQIDHFGLRASFANVYGISNKFAGSKVDRGHELIRVSNCDPKRTTMIGDTLHDFEVAEALGVNSLLISHGHQTAERLREKHSRVI